MENILSAIRANIQTVLVGEERAASLLLTALIAGGHVLIEDVPGMGKTVLARSLAKSVDAAFGRVQFTPDLLPSDVTGLNFFDRKAGDFVFSPGPVFCSILLADEINRATPRTQSALLECMAEGQVTVDGVTRRLEPPFFVIATQNPVETLGTTPARGPAGPVLLRISMDMPTKAQERQILERFQDSEPLESLRRCAPKSRLWSCRPRRGRSISTRRCWTTWWTWPTPPGRCGGRAGGQPPGHPGLMRASQAKALVEGRQFVTPEDIKEVGVPVIAHRLAVSGMAGSSQAQKEAAASLLSSVALPTEDWSR